MPSYAVALLGQAQTAHLGACRNTPWSPRRHITVDHQHIVRHASHSSRVCCSSSVSSPGTITVTQDSHVSEAASGIQVAPAGLDASATDSPTAGVSACPVLRSLRPPPSSGRGPVQSFLNQLRSPVEHQLDLAARGPVVQDWFLGMKSVMVTDLQMIKELAAGDGKTNVSSWPASTIKLLGENSLIAVGPEKHTRLRQLVTPALRSEVLEAHLSDIQAIARKVLSQAAAQTSSGKTFNALQGMKKYALEIVCILLLGKEEAEEHLEFLRTNFVKWSDVVFTPFTIDMWPFPYHTGQQSRQRLKEFIIPIIHRAREQVAQANGHGAADRTKNLMMRFVSEKDDAGGSLSDDELVDNMLNLMWAGHDTTAASMTNMLYYIAKHPHVLDKLKQEQKEIISKHGPGLTSSSVKQMVYADAVIKETMRMLPIVGAVARKTIEDVPLGDTLLPKDTKFAMGYTTLIKKDPRFANATGEDAPDNFNPDRHLTEQGQKIGQLFFWGFGAHACLGQNLATLEMKVFLAELARGYDYKADVNTEFALFPIPQPKNGLPVAVFEQPI